MGLTINFGTQLQSNGGTSIAQRFNTNVNKQSVFVMNKDGSQTEQVYKDGKLYKTITRVDKNKDGKFDNNEMYYVDSYYYDSDDTATIKRFVDKDGDGYNDTVTTYEYDKNRELKSTETIEEEDIDDVRNRNHLESEIYNRSMMAHKEGIYMR